ncbi:glycosyltransferase family 4 protein [Polaribacter sp. PL03]|uniref:glycosyltransferase family 4 protein n=1 Tax=Polaribacter sp. PL03 TaxID=3088353 RepID=UPI0029CBED68|nr:glycosyltransferase family 4 protein [Polaribacter sp. PL03]MDX6747671.1 glycosyltransferase family 4 protein [Polaribacter sp. PL03]
MKNKILLLTNIYTEPEVTLLNTTNVCHYFAKEWVEMGYEVKVIYNYHIYARILHFIANFFEKIIASSAVSVVNTIRTTKSKKYVLDGVTINKFPIFKALPRTKFPKKSIDKQIEKIVQSNKKDGFKPDLIIGHFHNPNLVLVNLLKNIYSVKTCVILHGDTTNVKKFYSKDYINLINNIDVWGYRSRGIGEEFEKKYGVRPKSFICYSGIPESIVANSKAKSISGPIKNFIYVGSLIKRKHPISLVRALNIAYPKKNFSLTFIGEGSEKKKIIKTSKELSISSNVNFSGHLTRDLVTENIETSDCFIMISESESFGLVYLEAMAKGCITIGSRNEGIDGVIVHGENGFLCESGNYKELAELIKQINNLSISEKNKISLNAIETAKNLTDFKAAKKYVDTVIKI